MTEVRVYVRDWLTLAERGILRLAMIVVGLLLILVGLTMTMSVLLLGVWRSGPAASDSLFEELGKNLPSADGGSAQTGPPASAA
jgi:hypothetical protein